MSVGNNGTRLVGNTEFYGGLSTDSKIGIENSYADAECLDVRKSPSQMTVLPMSRALDDGGAITGLITAMTQSKDGNIWAVDEKGALYKIDENNIVNKFSGGTGAIGTVSSSTISNVEYVGIESRGSDENPWGNRTLTYNSSEQKWQYNARGYTKDELRKVWGVTYSGDPANGDTITVTYSGGSFGSGFGLENSDIDDGLWFADDGHNLYSYGRVLNPTGAETATNRFDTLYDNSEYIDYAIEIQQDGNRIIYQSDPDIKRSQGTATASVKTSISESNADKILYLPACGPIYGIGVRFMAKGSGNVTLYIHDENNNVVAKSGDYPASSISTSGYTYFWVYPNTNDPVRSASNQFSPVLWSGDTIEAGDVLHLHLVASTSGFTVKTSVANDMYLTAAISSRYAVLMDTFNRKHPMCMFDKLYIGNGKYVSTKESSPLNYLDDTLYTMNALRLDDGFEVCSFGSSDEYLMIGAEKYSAGSSRGFQAGRIYFWDRQSEGPNFYIDCNMGSPKAIYNFGNIVYVIAAGALYAYTGGKELVKVRTLQGTDTEYSGRSSVTEVNPNMMAIRREILLLGFPSHTTAYTIRHGIYGWGSIDKNYPNCFTYNYKIPAETTEETIEQYNSDEQELRIGCVYNFNDSLFYSYEVKTTTTPEPTDEVPNPEPVTTIDVGLALVDNESGTSTTFKWESLQYDAGSPALVKQGCRIGIYFDPLPENTTIRPKYRLDSGEWQYIEDIYAKAGDRYITLEVNKRFHELQYGFDGTTANDLNTPVIKQVSAEIRVLNEEQKL